MVGNVAQAGGIAIAGTDQRFDVVYCAGVDASIPAADSGEDPESLSSDDAVWEPSQEPKSSSRRTKGSTKNGEWRERNRQAQKAFRQRQKVAACQPCSLRPPQVLGPCEAHSPSFQGMQERQISTNASLLAISC